MRRFAGSEKTISKTLVINPCSANKEGIKTRDKLYP